MTSRRFVATVAGLGPADVAALTHDLRRAAVSAYARPAQGTVTVSSRRNACFGVEDVLDVIAEWFERELDRRDSVQVVLEQPCRSGLRQRLAPRLRHRAGAPGAGFGVPEAGR
jgi:hypothetical protein